VPYIDRATLCQALHVLWQPALIPVRISPLGAQTPIVADVCPCGLGGCDGRAGWRIERRLARPVFSSGGWPYFVPSAKHLER
jgi:hypothetical protein